MCPPVTCTEILRQDRAVALGQLPAHFAQGLQVLGRVAGAHDGDALDGVLPLAALHHVHRPGEEGGEPAAAPDQGAGGVIEVQVGEHHVGDVAGGRAGPRQGPRQGDLRVDGEDLAGAIVEAVAAAGVDQRQAVPAAHQQAAAGVVDAVAVVGGAGPLPQGPRHDAEHGAAVEPHAAGEQRPDLDPAEIEGALRQSIPPRRRASSQAALNSSIVSTVRGWWAMAGRNV